MSLVRVVVLLLALCDCAAAGAVRRAACGQLGGSRSRRSHLGGARTCCCFNTAAHSRLCRLRAAQRAAPGHLVSVVSGCVCPGAAHISWVQCCCHSSGCTARGHASPTWPATPLLTCLTLRLRPKHGSSFCPYAVDSLPAGLKNTRILASSAAFWAPVMRHMCALAGVVERKICSGSALGLLLKAGFARWAETAAGGV